LAFDEFNYHVPIVQEGGSKSVANDVLMIVPPVVLHRISFLAVWGILFSIGGRILGKYHFIVVVTISITIMRSAANIGSPYFSPW
jgi:hypothetical protein